MINPWTVYICGKECRTIDADSRIDRIRYATNIEWLRHVVSWRDNQKTVQQAAESRLRKLEKEKQS